MEILLAVTALVAVVLSPAITFIVTRYTVKNQLDIAKRQIHSQTVSASRQAWIDALRNDVAEYMSLITRASVRPSELPGMLPEIVMLQMRVQLRLNRSEKLHSDLANRMAGAASGIRKYSADDSEAMAQSVKRLTDDIAVIEKLTSSIVKQEWDRIKEGE